MTDFKIGDKVKYTFPAALANPEWFACEITETTGSKAQYYRGKLIDKGTSSTYTDGDVIDGYTVILGDGSSLTPYDESIPVEFPDLIGRAPEPVPTPTYVGPFEVWDEKILDGTGRRIGYADGVLSGFTEDWKLALVMAAALNKYFGY